MDGSDENRASTFVKQFLNKRIYRYILGALSGAAIGWLYWEFIGCNGGSCPLTSSSTKTILVFSMMGMWFSYRK